MGETVGFIGMGRMGVPMALNLRAAGYGLRVYNRTAAKAEPLVQEGAKLCESPAQAAEGVQVVITMLSDDATVEAVVIEDEGILNGLAPGGIHLSMSTIGPETSRRLSDLHNLHDTHYLAAPVSGRPEAAAAKKLWVLLSGDDEDAKAVVRPLLDALGQGVFDLGADPGGANVAKLCGNFLIGAAIAAMGEAFTLAEKNGVDRQAVYEMLTQTIFACPAYQVYGKLVASEIYEPAGFSLPLGIKDIKLAQEVAEASDTPLPLAGLVHDRLIAARAKGREQQDWAVLARESSEAAGIIRKG